MRFPNGPTVWRCYLFFLSAFIGRLLFRLGSVPDWSKWRPGALPGVRDAETPLSPLRNETKRNEERERERKERKEKFSRPAKRTEQHNEAISCAPGQNRFPWPVFFFGFFFEVLKRDFLCDRNGFATDCTEFFFFTSQ